MFPKIPLPLKSRQGFALIVSLGLMSFIVLMVVSLSFYASTEQQRSTSVSAQDTARQNALLAVQEALAQLQAAAGPDQRVTARADILDSVPETEEPDSVVNPYWTGVWVTAGTASAPQSGVQTTTTNQQRALSLGAVAPSASQRSDNATWLVSTPKGVTVTPLAKPSVETVKVATLTTTRPTKKAVEVTVPLVTRSDGAGKYAYWVSDEGVKAKANLKDPTINTATGAFAPQSRAERQARYLIPHSHALTHLVPTVGAKDPRLLGSGQDIADVPSLAALSTLSLIDRPSSLTQREFLSTLSDDLTFHSYGVLSDVRRGGLKRDLTAAFENESGFNGFLTDYATETGAVPGFINWLGLSGIYGTSGNPPAFDPSNPAMQGIPWHSLYYYYNSYKGVMPTNVAPSGSLNVPKGVGNSEIASGPYSISPNGYSLSGYYDSNVNKYLGNVRVAAFLPLAIAYRIDITLDADIPQGSSSGDLYLNYRPELVLYNPYAVELSLNDFAFDRRISIMRTGGNCEVTGEFTTIDNPLTPQDETKIPQTIRTELNQSKVSGNDRMQLATKVGTLNSLKPGETRVFGLISDLNESSLELASEFPDLEPRGSSVGDTKHYSRLTKTTGSSDEVKSVPTGASLEKYGISKLDYGRFNVNDLYLSPKDSARWPRPRVGANNSDGSQSNTNRFISGPNLGTSDRPSNKFPIDKPTVIDLATTEFGLAGILMRLKGINPSGSSGPRENSAVPPLFMGNYGGYNFFDDGVDPVLYEYRLIDVGDGFNVNAIRDGIQKSGTETSWGINSTGKSSVAAVAERRVLRDVPSQPMVSLGQFMHMPAIAYGGLGGGAYASLPLGSMFTGGSLPSAYVDTTDTYKLFSPSGGLTPYRLHIDGSYIINEELFDRFFFSTFPASDLSPTGTVWPSVWSKFISGNPSSTFDSQTADHLINPRMKFYSSNGLIAKSEIRNVNRAAAHLMIDGAFNVNSTSVDAWMSFLGGLSGSNLEIYDATNKGWATVSFATKWAFSRFWSSASNTIINDPWSGIREFTDEQMRELAERIVTEVKLRGPFISFADFLNRRLGSSSSAMSRTGCLQAAIDKCGDGKSSILKLNQSVKSQGATIGNLNNRTSSEFPDVQEINMRDALGDYYSNTIGMPGYFMQQDIVQAASSAMSVRSDTFIIRAYGQSNNPITEEVEGTAYLEAVVQRVPEFFDSSSSGNNAYDNLKTLESLNEQMGRKFKIISIKWMNSDEI